MSSLRLALKKSLQESGLSSSKSSGKQQQRQKERREAGLIQRKRERRRPGDPPRKRGRPRKHPLPEQITDKEGNDDANDANFKSSKVQESSDENEFSDSNESTDKIEEDDEESDQILKNGHEYDGGVNKVIDDTLVGGSTGMKPISDGGEDSMEEEILKRRQKKLLKKLKQRDTAANVIQSRWKKNKKIAKVNIDSDVLEGEQIEQSSSLPASRSTSPKPSRDKQLSTVQQSTSLISNKSGKRDTVPAPAPDVLEWISGMPLKIQRRNMSTGLRVKVRFATKVRKRDGKIIRKFRWFGGLVTAVSTNGHKVKIKYDDGTTEVAKFPDKDIIVDDEENESHRSSAEAFQPTRIGSDLEEEAFFDDEARDDKMKVDKSQSPAKVEEEKGTKERGIWQAIDEEVKSEQSNKVETKSLLQSPNRESESDSTGKSQQLTRETETDDGTLSEGMLCEHNEEKSISSKSVNKIPEIIAGGNRSATEGDDDIITVEEEKTMCIETTTKTNEKSVPGSLEENEMRAESDQKMESGKSTSAGAKVLENNAEESTDNDDDEMESIAQGSGISEDTRGGGEKANSIPHEVTSYEKERQLATAELARNRTPDEALPECGTSITTDNKTNSEKEPPSENLSEDIANIKTQPIENKIETNSKTDEAINVKDIGTEIAKKEGADKLRSPIGGKMPTETNTDKSSNQTQSLKRKRESLESSFATKTSSSTTSLDALVPQIKTDQPAKELAKPVPTVAKSALEVKGATETLTQNENLQIMTSDNSAFDKKERRLKVRKENAKEIVRSSEGGDTTSPQDKTDASSLQRSGRRAAQQANERITARQENVIQENGIKPKKKKEKVEIKITASLNKKKRNASEAELDVTDEDNQWVQCDKCSKWRVLPSAVDVEKLPNQWYCEMNKYDPTHNSCDAPEQTPEEIAKARRKAKRRQARQRARQEAEAAANAKSGDPSRKERPRSPMRDSKSKKEEKNEGRKRASPMTNGSEEEENNSAQTDSGSDNVRDSKKARREEEAVTTLDNGASVKGKQRGRRRGGKELKEEKGKGGKSNKGSEDNQEWVQCEKCEKWRRLPPHISASDLPDVWYCTMNNWDPSTSSCDAAEDKADPNTHQTVNPFGHVGLHKLSYRSLIFGSGKKLHRPISERMRAAESLFSSTSLETPETVGSYPRVMYANSSMFVNRSNAARAAEERDSDKFSFLNLMSHSNLWSELRSLSKQKSNPVSSGKLSKIQLPDAKTPYSSFPLSIQQEMKEMVCYALGTELMAGHEVLFETQCRPWEGVPQVWTELRSVCTIESIVPCLLDLVKDGRVEVSSGDKERGSEIEEIPRFRRVVRSSIAPVLKTQKEQQNGGSRNMKIRKPWKQ
eukprot:CAMPEP_0194207136 /NCGR_PEP_ID=MMETSP0156-20130528/5976_1 /TAXON_ID=33649 /ORGANISM="Thalassionema nitzschioides, Strain L26-B" /LENGTH=1361 /DNA_ID=CAMNT_0038933839 /DNA_START=99 /DNA_END=4184 /DNA_ORIENTATION=-